MSNSKLIGLWLGMSTLLLAAALGRHFFTGLGAGALALLLPVLVGGVLLSEFVGLREAEPSPRLLFCSAFVMLYFLLGLTLFDALSR